MRSMNLHVPKGPGEKRHNAGLAHGSCGGFCPAKQQLAWLTAKIAPLEWRVEVDFGTAVTMLEGHVASSRPTWTRRSRITRASFFLRLP